jgi:hypothetical protein
MSAARSIPFEHNVAAQPITIDSTFTPSPQGVIIAAGQPVSFKNNSGAEISLIHFQPNPPGLPPSLPPGPTLFADIPDFANGATDEQSSDVPGSVNYFITDENGKQHGPYSIQVGNTVPLYIQVAASVTAPDPAAIPKGGKLVMFSADTNSDSYTVLWRNGDPFSPLLQSASSGMSNNAIRTGSLKVGEYAYTVVKQGVAGPGGGHIIIQN